MQCYGNRSTEKILKNGKWVSVSTMGLRFCAQKTQRKVKTSWIECSTWQILLTKKEHIITHTQIINAHRLVVISRQIVCFAYQIVCSAFGWLFEQIIKRGKWHTHTNKCWKRKQQKAALVNRSHADAHLWVMCGWSKTTSKSAPMDRHELHNDEWRYSVCSHQITRTVSVDFKSPFDGWNKMFVLQTSSFWLSRIDFANEFDNWLSK